jgi:DNA-nicking Smr family endonuclease
LWLSLPEFRRFIVSFEQAHASHGGEGALYLHLRRRTR